jgi:hypothetical protein
MRCPSGDDTNYLHIKLTLLLIFFTIKLGNLPVRCYGLNFSKYSCFRASTSNHAKSSPSLKETHVYLFYLSS